jgi:hypothetical protein
MAQGVDPELKLPTPKKPPKTICTQFSRTLEEELLWMVSVPKVKGVLLSPLNVFPLHQEGYTLLYLENIPSWFPHDSGTHCLH